MFANLRANLKITLMLLVIILLAIFLLQNTQQAPVKFLFFDSPNVPISVLVLATSLMGFVVGYLVAATGKRRRARRSRQQQEPAPASQPTAQPGSPPGRDIAPTEEAGRAPDSDQDELNTERARSGQS